MEEDADGYTASEHAYMDAISILEDDIGQVFFCHFTAACSHELKTVTVQRTN